MNTGSCLIVDAGGSNTRFHYSPDIRYPPSVEDTIKTYPARSIDAFREAIEKTLEELPEKPQSAVIAMAGIVEDHKTGMMTNWEKRTDLSVDLLNSWGLPDNSILANDLEAAAYAIDAIAFRADQDRIVYLSSQRPVPYTNSVIIAPGTGLGMSVLLYAGSRLPVVLTNEAQHCPAGSYDERHVDIIRMFAEQKGEAPSWEDLVSGRGLEFLYFYATGRTSKASQIAAGAKAGDLGARRAVYDFYNIAAEAAQTLALLVRPVGGVYLCGDTTVKNRELIMGSDFAERFCSNPVHRDTLASYPLAVLDIENIVVRGAIRMGQLLLGKLR